MLVRALSYPRDKIVQLNDPTEDHSTVDRGREQIWCAPKTCDIVLPMADPLPARVLLTENPQTIYLSTVQVCNLLDIPRGTWTGWVSKNLAPSKDYQLGGSPLWKLTTILEYLRNAPGGRLGYPVG